MGGGVMPGAFLYDNSINGAVLTSSQANVPSMPVANLQDAQPRRRARLNASVSSVIADFGTNRAVDCAALISTTLGAGATVRTRIGSEAGIVDAVPLVAFDFISSAPSSMAAWTPARGGVGGSGEATYFNGSGMLVNAAAGEWRIDHDPVTLQRRGLLLEPERTNYIANPNCVGAVAGTPGTPPSGWAIYPASGISVSVVGVGSESGINYVDLQFLGTASASPFQTAVQPEAVTFPSAAQNEVWTQSFYLKLIAGSLSNAGFFRVLSQWDSGFNFLGEFWTQVILSNANSGVTLSSQRYWGPNTLTASGVAYTNSQLYLMPVAGATINCTIRVGLPQLEKGGFVTSPMRPAAGSTGLTSRAADGGYSTVNIQNNFSIYVEHQLSGFSAADLPIVQLSNGTNNVARLRIVALAAPYLDAIIFEGGVASADFGNTTVASLGVTHRAALGYASNNAAAALNGVAQGTDNSVILPALTLFELPSSEKALHLRALRIYRNRLSDAQLLALSGTGSTLVASQVTGDTGTIAAEAEAANQGNVIMTLPAPAVGRYLRIDIENPLAAFTDIGVLAAGQLWRVMRGTAYGIREGRVMLDRRDRNPFTGAEFPVPAIANPRLAAFTLPSLSVAEARGQHRALLAALGAAGDALWIAELNDTMAERNRRAIWGAVNTPGEDAAISRDNLPLSSRAFRIQERL